MYAHLVGHNICLEGVGILKTGEFFTLHGSHSNKYVCNIYQMLDSWQLGMYAIIIR